MDDIGFCHGVNLAFQRITDQGLCSAVSVIVTTPWLDEAVALERAEAERQAALGKSRRPLFRDPHKMQDLLSYQLISGVVAGHEDEE